MAVDCHLDGMAIKVLEHVDPLLGWKDTLKRTKKSKTKTLDLGIEENLNDFDAFVVDLCIRRRQKWEKEEGCDEHVDSIPCKMCAIKNMKNIKNPTMWENGRASRPF